MVRLVLVFLLASFVPASGCSLFGGSDESGSGVSAEGSEEAMDRVGLAVRALGEPDPTIDYVAAHMKGVIKGRTSAQALIHYEGYRATLTTPAEIVTRIRFDFIEEQPTMAQLTEAYGVPEDAGRGWLYRHSVRATGATIRILAEPATPPATEDSPVRRILIEGEKFR